MTAQQTQIDFAKAARDSGIERAVSNADRKNDGWSETVYEYFKLFLRGHRGTFQMEAFRDWVKDLVPSPPSLRSFGFIPLKAAKEGLIKRVGHAPVKNIKAHRAFSSVWQRV